MPNYKRKTTDGAPSLPTEPPSMRHGSRDATAPGIASTSHSEPVAQGQSEQQIAPGEDEYNTRILRGELMEPPTETSFDHEQASIKRLTTSGDHHSQQNRPSAHLLPVDNVVRRSNTGTTAQATQVGADEMRLPLHGGKEERAEMEPRAAEIASLGSSRVSNSVTHLSTPLRNQLNQEPPGTMKPRGINTGELSTYRHLEQNQSLSHSTPTPDGSVTHDIASHTRRIDTRAEMSGSAQASSAPIKNNASNSPTRPCILEYLGCQARMWNTYQLEQHMIKGHDDGNQFKCPEYRGQRAHSEQAMFATQRDYYRHMRSYHSSNKNSVKEPWFNPLKILDFPFVEEPPENVASYREANLKTKLEAIWEHLEKANRNPELSEHYIDFYRSRGVLRKDKDAKDWVFTDPKHYFRPDGSVSLPVRS